MPDQSPPDPIYLATAVEAVLRAGETQMARFGRQIRVEKKGAIDLVTEIDLEIERGFRAMIADRFPDHEVLGEEFGGSPARDGQDIHARPGERAPRFCWVFDPIDGTTNYAHGLPIFCSSLALEVDGEPVVAAVYDPSRKELFTAERGQGARLNGQPLRVSTAESLIDSLLVTGFHYDVQKDPGEVITLFGAFIGKARAVRRLGSAALDLCYVAAGRFDGFWEKKLEPWDIAGGALVVMEAGGRITTMAGGRYGSREGSVLATNGRIHDEMLATILG